MSVDKNQCVYHHINLTQGGIGLLNRSCHTVHSSGYHANIRPYAWHPQEMDNIVALANHMDHRKSGGHSNFADPKDLLPILRVSSIMSLTLLMCWPCCSHHWSHFPIPGLLGHRNSVRGHPGCVCDAQPGLALATHPLGCPAAPLCCLVFCRYPLRHLNLCPLSLLLFTIFQWGGGGGHTIP